MHIYIYIYMYAYIHIYIYIYIHIYGLVIDLKPPKTTFVLLRTRRIGGPSPSPLPLGPGDPGYYGISWYIMNYDSIV